MEYVTLCKVIESYSSGRVQRSALSQHESQVDVLETIADVDTTIHGSVAAVVCVVAGPLLTVKHNNGARGVLDQTPALLGLILADAVKEIVIVDSLLSGNKVLLLALFNLSQVLPALQVAGILA